MIHKGNGKNSIIYCCSAHNKPYKLTDQHVLEKILSIVLCSGLSIILMLSVQKKYLSRNDVEILQQEYYALTRVVSNPWPTLFLSGLCPTFFSQALMISWTAFTIELAPMPYFSIST